MIVFDVDGTLIGGETTDWASFDAAIHEVAGFTPSAAFYEGIEEVTAQAIVHQALAHFPLEERKRMERSICDGYLRRLQAAHQSDPSSFPALEGVLTLLHTLKQEGMPVALGTGDWLETNTFKLRAAGIPFDDLPRVTSSDFYSRADIIAGAVSRSGRKLNEAVYIGDGLWDFRACQKLGIPFIGVGRRRERLEKAGAPHTLPDLDPTTFRRLLETISRQRSPL